MSNVSVTTDAEGTVTGNTYDKYGTTNPVARRLQAGFERTLEELFAKAAPKTLLDVGCGEGVLTHQWAQKPGMERIVGLDLDDPQLHEAWKGRQHPCLQYVVMKAENLPFGDDEFEVATAIEVLEHVPDPASVVSACATLLKPGGRLFLSTLNRTPAAFALAIVGAEYIARLLPKGTHQYRDFIKPSELARLLRDAGLAIEDVSGLLYEPWRNAARVVRRTDVNYLACARKPE